MHIYILYVVLCDIYHIHVHKLSATTVTKIIEAYRREC